MNRAKFLILGLGLLLYTPFVQAQSSNRIEIETGEANNLTVVPIGPEGLVYFSEAQRGRYTFSKYNTDLRQEWSVNCTVNPDLDLAKHVFYNNSLYLLFSRFKSPTYQVVKLNTRAGFAEKFEMYSLNRLEITDFEAMDNNVFIAGKTKNEPILLHINLFDKKTRVLPTAFKGKAEIQSIEVDSVRGQLNVAFANWRGRENNMIIRSFSPQGDQLSSVMLPAANDYNLLTGRLSSVTETEDVVLGTYGNRGSVYSTASRGFYTRSFYQGTADYTQGLYISKLKNGEPEFTKYYSFTDFKNFFKFMGARQQDRMAKKISRRKQQGKDMKLQYRLLVHDIIRRNGQYIMVAEVYYPEYRNNNMGMYPGMYGGWYGGWGNPYGFGSPYGRNFPIFDGYVYTHAVIAGFDLQGNLLWDNSFEINDVKTYTLREKVRASFSGDNIMLAYSDKGMLKTKVIRGGEIVEGKEAIPLHTEHEGDKVKKAFTDNVDYWYSNNFVAWGYQRIRNQKDETVKGKRNVFYFNKIGF
jgi:hypothetical protein